jgi:hemerythrin-like metal-binding protein
MTYLEWHPSLEVGFWRIDVEHRALVEMLNRLHTAMDEEKAQEEIVRILAFLRDYTVTHFKMEEDLMILHGYPDSADHFAAHVELVLHVSDLLADIRSGKKMTVGEVSTFLEAWLVDHILSKDKELGAFLTRKGVRA